MSSCSLHSVCCRPGWWSARWGRGSRMQLHTLLSNGVTPVVDMDVEDLYLAPRDILSGMLLLVQMPVHVVACCGCVGVWWCLLQKEGPGACVEDSVRATMSGSQFYSCYVHAIASFINMQLLTLAVVTCVGVCCRRTATVT